MVLILVFMNLKKDLYFAPKPHINLSNPAQRIDALARTISAQELQLV